MVAPDYHEEDGHSTASSTTQLPSQHPLRQSLRGHRDGGTDLSTVPPTPLNHRLHLLSPLRTETPSHGYNLRLTPDREGSQGDGFGLAVAGGSVAGSAVGGVGVSGAGGGGVSGGGGGRVGGRGVVGDAVVDGRRGGVVAAGRTAAPVAGGIAGRGVGARVARGVVGRAVVGGGGRGTSRTRQSTGPALGGTARGGVRNYSTAEVDSLLQTIKAVCPIGNEHWEVVANCIAIAMQFAARLLSP
jgi:hypothetical protein